jgi:hypothetical protein
LPFSALTPEETYTLSIKLLDGSVKSVTIVAPTGEGAFNGANYNQTWSGGIRHNEGNASWSVYIAINYTETPQTLDIVAAKLELGSVSTLEESFNPQVKDALMVLCERTKTYVTVAGTPESTTAITPLSAARYSLAAATDGNGNVLFGGGYESSACSAVVDKYDTTGTRTTLTSLSVARHYLAAATDGNGNVLFGRGYEGSACSAVVDKCMRQNAPKCINIPLFALYKFQEHETEQRALTATVLVNTPNTGYFRFGGTVEL